MKVLSASSEVCVFTLEPLAKWVPSHFVAQGAIPRASIRYLCRRLGGGMEIIMLGFNMNFRPEAFVENLTYMGQGMLGIFVVIGVIVLFTMLLTKISSSIGNRSKKDDEE